MEPSPSIVAIVDDDAAVRRALRRLVLSYGHDVATYADGEALLDGLDAGPITHILLDLHMPGLQGPALLEQIRARTAAARIVVMTGLDVPGSREACLAAGADVFVRKPLKPADLQRLLGTGAPAANGTAL